MNINNKIITLAMCALISGFGIFAANKSAQAYSASVTPVDTSGMSVEQLQQVVDSLLAQIRQVVALIAQLKPRETCGNGICRFGETAASCPADCGTKSACIPEGQSVYSSGQCCPGLVATNFVNFSYKCVKNGADAPHTCSADIDCISVCGDCVNRSVDAVNYACSYGKIITGTDKCQCVGHLCQKNTAVCGNGICENGETKSDCSRDCGQAPTIEVLSPQAGEVFSQSTAQIPFSWKWSEVVDPSAVFISLLDANGREVYGKILAADNLYYTNLGGGGVVPAPVNLVIPLGRYQYRVRICTSLAKTNCAHSGYFTIVKTTNSTVDPSIAINIISPASGEILREGDQYTIRWTASGLPANATQTINIMNGTRGTIDDPNHPIITGLSSTATSYTWTVAGNNGWGVGILDRLQKNMAGLLGVETAHAANDQYVIRIDAAVPGTLGSVGWGVSEPFTISQ